MLDLLLISIPVGFIGSLIGLGGASILIPLLVYFDIPVKVAIASAMVSIVATSSGSASAYVHEGLANVKVAMYLEMFTIAGAIIGATVTTRIPSAYLYFFFAFFLLTSFLKTGQKNVRENKPVSESKDTLGSRLELDGTYFDREAEKQIFYRSDHPLIGGAGMMVAGIAAGMLGIGAGAFKVTIQENILKLPPKVASSTSNFIIGMTALAGTSVYLFSGLLDLSLMAPMAVGTTIGALAGGRMLNRLNDRLLKILFYIVVITLIFQMLIKGIRSW